MNNPAPGVSPEESLIITFGAEEVYVLLRLLHGVSMPGLDLAPLELDARGIPSKSAMRALAAATNSLIAHGVAEPVALPDSEVNGTLRHGNVQRLKFNLPADVVALLGACAFSNYVLRLSLLTSVGELDVYLHDLDHVGVAHAVPLAGIHKFTGLRGREGVLNHVRALIGLEAQSAGSSTSFFISEYALNVTRDAALAGKREEAERVLLGAGIASLVAAEFVTAMSSARGFGAAIIVSQGPDGALREQKFAFVAGLSTGFLLMPSEGPSGVVYRVQAVSAQQMLHHFQATLPAESNIPNRANWQPMGN